MNLGYLVFTVLTELVKYIYRVPLSTIGCFIISCKPYNVKLTTINKIIPSPYL